MSNVKVKGNEVTAYFRSSPQELDEAARRRLVKRLYIPLPEADARRQIIHNLLAEQSYRLNEDQVEEIVRRADGN